MRRLFPLVVTFLFGIVLGYVIGHGKQNQSTQRLSLSVEHHEAMTISCPADRTTRLMRVIAVSRDGNVEISMIRPDDWVVTFYPSAVDGRNGVTFYARPIGD